MNSKLCVFLLLVGVSIAVAGRFKQQKIDEKCGTDEACHAAAKRCLGNKDKKHPKDDGGLTHSQKLTAFNKCLADNGQSSRQINEADCVEDAPAGAGGRAKRSHHNHKCKKEIIDILTSLEESVAGPVRCCFATELKSEKVNNDGSINVDYFRKKVNERVTDQSVKDILENTLNTCLTKGAECNVYAFIECSISQCIDEIQASGSSK